MLREEVNELRDFSDTDIDYRTTDYDPNSVKVTSTTRIGASQQEITEVDI